MLHVQLILQINSFFKISSVNSEKMWGGLSFKSNHTYIRSFHVILGSFIHELCHRWQLNTFKHHECLYCKKKHLLKSDMGKVVTVSQAGFSNPTLPEPFFWALVSVRAFLIWEELLCCTLSVLVEVIFGRDLLWQLAMSQRKPSTVVGRGVVPCAHRQPLTKPPDHHHNQKIL